MEPEKAIALAVISGLVALVVTVAGYRLMTGKMPPNAVTTAQRVIACSVAASDNE